MQKVLVFGMNENPGGVEKFLMSYFDSIDKKEIQFDFLCNTLNEIAYEKEIVRSGSKVYHIPPRSKGLYNYYQSLNKFFKEHFSEYDTIWVNVNSLANIDYLIMAKKFKIKRRIIHSHNAQNMDTFLRCLLHKINRSRISKFATDFWACSEKAAQWFYNKNILDKSFIIPNAIDVNGISFDKTKRSMVRKELNWDDNFIIGNVGRLHFQKNQDFIIDVFNNLLNRMPNARLVLVGQGPDQTKLKEKVVHLGIQEKVYFAGVKNDIQAWLSSFDMFFFPSKFEGLSIALLEAEANGLICLSSEEIYIPEISVTDNCHFISLNEPISKWVDEIVAIGSQPVRERSVAARCFENSIYNISNSVEVVEEKLKENGKN